MDAARTPNTTVPIVAEACTALLGEAGLGVGLGEPVGEGLGVGVGFFGRGILATAISILVEGSYNLN
jgi:hypothetical protein